MKILEMMRGRGMTVEGLAERIGSSRAHVSQVLNGKPGRGGQTRRKLARHLTAEELGALGWRADGGLASPNVRTGKVKVKGTILDLERKKG